MNVGVDVGGTFTDAVSWDGALLRAVKVPTELEQSRGVVAALAALGASRSRLLHGTTVATNAVLARTGARTVLVTDSGFEDLVEIGRQDRPSLYDVEARRTEPLVPADRRVGVPGRASASAAATWNEHVDWDEIAARVAALRPEAIAVSMLYAFAEPRRERAVAEALHRSLPGIPVAVSSEVAPEFREFERASTTILDAYLRPVVSSYLASLQEELEAGHLVESTHVMRSSGGLLTLEAATVLPVATLLSGPAAGVVAAGALGDATGRASVISFDMGGTSTDVCRVDHGRPGITYERAVDGLPCRMPSVAIHTVGAGGGSIAWVDDGGALRVGPHSAGAHPGPAAYGRGGTEPTVTDAGIALGRIDANMRLGGSVRLDASAARSALGRLAGRAGLTTVQTAIGIVDVVEAHMERALRRVSVEEGVDPRGATLVAFGGAGGLHATALARRLEMSGVVVAPLSGVFSAVGLLLSPPRADAARSLTTGESLELVATSLLESARRSLRSRAGGQERLIVDLRYVGQSHETPVSFAIGEEWGALAERFHAAHRSRNGFARPTDPVEAVTVRAEVTGVPAMRWSDLPEPRPSGEPRRGRRAILTAQGEVDASVWWRPALGAGAVVEGPAVIEEAGATTLLGSGERARVDEAGALEITW